MVPGTDPGGEQWAHASPPSNSLPQLLLLAPKRSKFSNRAVTDPDRTVTYLVKICNYFYAKVQIVTQSYL